MRGEGRRKGEGEAVGKGAERKVEKSARVQGRPWEREGVMWSVRAGNVM